MDSQRVALITGGSSGLGFSIAKRLANSGYTLILIARNKKKLLDAASKIKRSSVAQVIYFSADVSDETAMQVVADY